MYTYKIHGKKVIKCIVVWKTLYSWQTFYIPVGSYIFHLMKKMCHKEGQTNIKKGTDKSVLKYMKCLFDYCNSSQCPIGHAVAWAWEWSWINIPEDAHDHKDHEQGGPRAGWLIDWRSFPVFASPSLPTEPAPPHPCYQVLHFSTNGIFCSHSIERKKLCHYHVIKYTCPKWGPWDLVLDIVIWGGHD